MDYFSKGSMAHLAVISILFSGLLYLCIWSPPSFSKSLTNISIPKDELTIALDRASMGNKTVIIAIVNKAYIQRDNLEKTMFDLFLEGFWLGEDTRGLLDHLLVVAMDQVAYDRCKFLRFHCYRLVTEGVDFREEKIYMSKDFIMVMWKRTQFLGDVLKHGYNFIFTDTDVMWLRNPFLKLIKDEEAEDDLQISCDGFNGNSRSEANQINTDYFSLKETNTTTFGLRKGWSPIEVFQAAQRSHNEFWEASKLSSNCNNSSPTQQHFSPQHWTPPQADLLKINCNAAYDDETNTGGLGVIGRSAMGAQIFAISVPSYFTEIITERL
ncbi:uncharacterized protein At1g28695-like isoform X2 [Macadamia integrifolia]|uniref:uncharacterized protein At1g28695-like isoform X2 n=1 Tax=Macadamia integrifolia TaxID=60698 RepID=UPI001C4FEFB4|nr:uncharacterized protein At1g28695-like isoform X2 [Macadamia integrifolia]